MRRTDLKASLTFEEIFKQESIDFKDVDLFEISSKVSSNCLFKGK